ncbi:LPXTG cell wall anchor domain-containing protein [Nocardioides sp. GXZ039]|uniref:LPXTG cell wall anchor domain-containing protein n=1 Tax=Nocardioides sp. GXZ039 TaxID=3136018 RepID=UPI0030F4072D
MHRVRIDVRRIGVLLLVPIAISLAPAPAWAGPSEDDRLGLSSDGTRWGHSLEPLFAQDERWVPGQTRTATFHVRNQGSDAGLLTVTLAEAARDGLRRSGHLHVAVRAHGAPWTSTAATGEQVLLDAAGLDAGESLRLDVRVALDAAAPNATMLQSSDLDFRVRLTDADATGPHPTSRPTPDPTDRPQAAPGSDSPAAILPETGAAVTPALVWLGLALTGIGGFLLALRRNRVEERHG